MTDKIEIRAENLQERMGKIRESIGVTYHDIEDRTQIDRSTVCKIETGKIANPGIYTFEKLVNAMDMTLDIVPVKAKRYEVPQVYSKSEQDVIDRVIRIMRGKDIRKQNMLYSFFQMVFPNEIGIK